MAEIITLNTHTDHRGSLTFVDQEIPFQIKNTEYLYGYKDFNKVIALDKPLAIISLKGSITVNLGLSNETKQFHLTAPNLCLICHISDHQINFKLSEGDILLLLFSE